MSETAAKIGKYFLDDRFYSRRGAFIVDVVDILCIGDSNSGVLELALSSLVDDGEVVLYRKDE